MYAYDTI